jgi:glycosyltransferase involved in cell wall biosynthesis
LLASDATGLDAVEIIVIDDGSPEPVAPVLESRVACPPVSLRCIRQPNAGPAAARNAGFRASRGEIMLCIDDDVICPANLIRQHVEAHRRFPGSVIIGRCVLVQPSLPTPLYHYLNSRGYDVGQNAGEEFTEGQLVASGQISFERATFDEAEGIYRDDLATPAAEEYELSIRLRDHGIPVLLATGITALHDQPVEIGSLCRQAFKHGKGCAEAAQKCSAALTLPALRTILEVNQPAPPGAPTRVVVKYTIKRALSAASVRTSLLRIVKTMEYFVRPNRWLALVYHYLLGLYFFAGIQSGLEQYSGSTLRMSVPGCVAGAQKSPH